MARHEVNDCESANQDAWGGLHTGECAFDGGKLGSKLRVHLLSREVVIPAADPFKWVCRLDSRESALPLLSFITSG
jgi:hypothetical protein